MYRFVLLLFALALSAPLAHAQSAALTTALDHLEASSTALGLSTADLSDVAVTDEYVSRHSGVTHLYLRQKVNGIEVYNARASAHVSEAGRVAGVHSTFVPNATSRAAAPTPTLSADAAVQAAAGHLGLTVTGSLSTLEPADERHRTLLADGGISLDPIPVQLVYFVTEEGALRLAWDLLIYQTDAEHAWSLRVDAGTGAILEQNDLVVHDEWGGGMYAARDRQPAAEEPIVGTRGGSSSYNVWAVPLESPIHGERTLEVDPYDITASPSGWHDDGMKQYTITRGNNVHAYEDRDADNMPGYSPDGGTDLAFDFPVDLETQQPSEYQDAAITNLFYWNNITHDVLVRYGFDEASGNFQQTNFSGQGQGGDYVRAEAQDGSGTGNANFFTPADGSRPRMQMYEWTGSGLTVTAPEVIAGVYQSGAASFGGPFPPDFPVTPIVPVISIDGGDYPDGAPDLDLADRGCEEIFNPDEIEGNIALIERGGCEFGVKVLNAEQAGAIAVIIHNNSRNGEGETGSPEEVITMGGGAVGDQVTIPSVFVAQSTGQVLFENQPAEGYVRSALNRDSDLDNGVIVHEYIHGLSNRLTGGPSNSGCLTTFDAQGDPVDVEQMGEGWSDWYALMLTMVEEDTPDRPRGIGTYVSYEETSGPGIRPYPYTTDMVINPSTYAYIEQLSIPHGVGSVWAQMLWEMTWNLIETEGFDPDLIGGMGGNNIALQLVTDGMKLQPCLPGFVDGRNAILEADTLLYGGAYSPQIWRAFAKRGLGYGADQGEITLVDDGTVSFDLPPGVFPTSSEESALPNGYAFSAAYPNPFSERAQFTLEVAEAQDVSVMVYDVMGRTVATLHDGPLAAGTRHGFALDGGSLASGVYLVRVTGDRFAETRRVTLLR